jgi:ELP3 family radical SAM enzyme/protein acetyltransferase
MEYNKSHIDDIENTPFDPKNNSFLNNEAYISILKDLAEYEYEDKTKYYNLVNTLKQKYKAEPRKFELASIYKNLIDNKQININKCLENYLMIKACRSDSGVLVITIFTSPYPKSGEKISTFSCKYDCHYCPNEPGQPRSYLLNEPGVRRANMNDFNTIRQFRNRADTLNINGHTMDKIEILVLGGTWSSYPRDYQEEFIRDIFYSANTYYNNMEEARLPLTLIEEQKINTNKTNCRIIGLTLETRPDNINLEELKQFRYYGCTRVQLGVQHTDNEILKKINRRCTIEDAKKAIKLLKNCCFKIDIHIMPDLPGSSPEKDKIMFNTLLNDEDLQVDDWKIYPCEVVPYTKIEKWFKEGLYQPYSSKELMEVLIDVKSKVHPWIRLNRVIRDIPNEYIIAGNCVTNLRQVIKDEMTKRGLSCKCIRCREVKKKKNNIDDCQRLIRKYKASDGIEYFISFESSDRKFIYGFCRLRICNEPSPFDELNGCALIRELHVYGVVVSNKDDKLIQHNGLGKKMIKTAEELALLNGYKKIAVISGIGVKNYYNKLGYDFANSNFMIKKLSIFNKNYIIYLITYLLQKIIDYLFKIIYIIFGNNKLKFN